VEVCSVFCRSSMNQIISKPLNFFPFSGSLHSINIHQFCFYEVEMLVWPNVHKNTALLDQRESAQTIIKLSSIISNLVTALGKILLDKFWYWCKYLPHWPIWKLCSYLFSFVIHIKELHDCNHNETIELELKRQNDRNSKQNKHGGRASYTVA
jgi:hypothetical protein